jgi:hypothetical protein
LKCFKCASGDTKCQENFDVQNCPAIPDEVKSKGGRNVCLNLAFMMDDDQLIIKRECGVKSELSSLKIFLFLFFPISSTVNELNACVIHGAFTGKSKSCHLCETDLCNGSSKVNFNALAMLVPFTIVIFSKLF